MRLQNLHIIPTGIALALCIMISVPVDAYAQRRPNNAQTEQREKNNNSNRQSSNGRRPNNNTSNNNSSIKNRPQSPNQEPSRPQGNVKPNSPSHNPGPGHVQPHNNHPQPQPHNRPIPYVAPPRNWHPHSNAPVIRGVLGITFGSLYNATLNHLRHNNYIISHHTNDAIYLTNAVQCGYTWNDAIIHFAWGKLTSAQFINSSMFNNTRRYDEVNRVLTEMYGRPVSVRRLDDGGHECIWYGGDRQGMVSLEYYYHAGRYYTTLSFRN